MDIPVLLTLLVVHQLGLMSPGPDFVVVVESSLLSSRRAGLFTAPALHMRLHGVRHYLDRTMGVVLVALGLRVALSER